MDRMNEYENKYDFNQEHNFSEEFGKHQCECKCEDRKKENGLEEFHKLVKMALGCIKEAEEANEQAKWHLSSAVCLQEKALKQKEQAKIILTKAFCWLRMYGNKYNCNYNNPQCQQILQELQCLVAKEEKLEEYALHEVKEACMALKQDSEIDKKIAYLGEKYMKCVHHKCPVKPGCGCQDDMLW